jgi:hypothetical protein
MELFAISYGFEREYLDKAIRTKYLLSLSGEYRESRTVNLIYLKTEKSFGELIELFSGKFDKEDHFVIFILEKGKFKCLNEDSRVFKWLWE